MVQQGFANAGARWRIDLRALRAIFSVRQNFDDGHGVL
jgi:hypothetical protein